MTLNTCCEVARLDQRESLRCYRPIKTPAEYLLDSLEYTPYLTGLV